MDTRMFELGKISLCTSRGWGEDPAGGVHEIYRVYRSEHLERDGRVGRRTPLTIVWLSVMAEKNYCTTCQVCSKFVQRSILMRHAILPFERRVGIYTRHYYGGP